MTKDNRPARFLAALLALAMLLSVAYIALEAGHDCAGEGCAVCAQLDCCLHLLEQLTPAACVLAVARLLQGYLLPAVAAVLYGIRRITLISLKVKLSD